MSPFLLCAVELGAVIGSVCGVSAVFGLAVGLIAGFELVGAWSLSIVTP